MAKSKIPNKQIDELLDEFAQQSFGAVWTSKKAKVEFDHSQIKSQLATLIKGIVPEGKSIDVDDYSESHEYAGAIGFNQCRQLMLENIASLFKEEVSDELD